MGSGTTKIPLLKESAAYAQRLLGAARGFGEPMYQFHRRVNWSHRYSRRFYAREAECFMAAPEDYLAGRPGKAPDLPDVFTQRLRLREIAVAFAKVAAHWLFLALGRMGVGSGRHHGLDTYRKAYVDDIELVFDPAEPGVLRAVYPFPLNAWRQLRYLQELRRRGYRFRLAGIPYTLRDVAHLALRRDVCSLMRMESRAQIRHARCLHAAGFQRFQLSDEFDMGSLDFARTLRHLRVSVVNSAHGVGNYLPVHAYEIFETLTMKQQRYYLAARSCRYVLRRLNDIGPPADTNPSGGTIDLVVLGQTSKRISEIVVAAETSATVAISAALGGVPGIRLWYKPHPNATKPSAPAGFQFLSRLDQVNGRPGTVFVSLFSTCQIDPNVKGTKVLLREGLIRPEIIFDESETIVDVDGLVVLVKALAAHGPSS